MRAFEILTESNSEYGSWISPTGDVHHVGYEEHEEAIYEIENISYGDAIHYGWIRVVNPTLTRWHIETGDELTRKAISALRSEMDQRGAYIDLHDPDHEDGMRSYETDSAKQTIAILNAYIRERERLFGTDDFSRFLVESDSPKPSVDAFLLTKWQERATERGLPTPNDLSGACKFAAAFAQGIFGGKLEANELHTWLRNGSINVDFTKDSADTRDLIAGRVPASMQAYVNHFKIEVPEDIYEADRSFMKSRDFKNSIQANHERVTDWVIEWKSIPGRW